MSGMRKSFNQMLMLAHTWVFGARLNELLLRIRSPQEVAHILRPVEPSRREVIHGISARMDTAFWMM